MPKVFMFGGITILSFKTMILRLKVYCESNAKLGKVQNIR